MGLGFPKDRNLQKSRFRQTIRETIKMSSSKDALPPPGSNGFFFLSQLSDPALNYKLNLAHVLGTDACLPPTEWLTVCLPCPTVNDMPDMRQALSSWPSPKTDEWILIKSFNWIPFRRSIEFTTLYLDGREERRRECRIANQPLVRSSSSCNWTTGGNIWFAIESCISERSRNLWSSSLEELIV